MASNSEQRWGIQSQKILVHMNNDNLKGLKRVSDFYQNMSLYYYIFFTIFVHITGRCVTLFLVFIQY